jgi:hypothetical protein
MRVSPETVAKAASGIDRLINSIPEQTQQSIKGIFFLLIFGLVIGGAVYGGMKGKSAAEIKSTPIIERTNDAFEVDMKRERGDGNFSSMLDSDLINELKASNVNKAKFEIRSMLEPEVDKGIIEPELHRKAIRAGDVQTHDPIFEDENKSKPRIDSGVKPLEKKSVPYQDDKDTVVQTEKKEIRPLQNKKSAVPDRSSAEIDRKPGLKKRGADIRAPERQNTEGIIED